MKRMTNKQAAALVSAIRIIHRLAKNDEEFEEAIKEIQETIEKGVTANADQAKR